MYKGQVRAPPQILLKNIFAVLWIRDIVVPSTYPYHWLTDPDPAYFVSGWQDVNKKYDFWKFFCLLNFEGTLTSVFKDTKSKRTER